MEDRIKERYVTNIMSGVVICNVAGMTYVIHETSLFDKAVAEQIYEDKLREAELRGIMSQDELVNQLMSHGLWGVADQAEIDTLPIRIENLKVQLYQAYHRYKGRDPIRKQINNLKSKLMRLTIKRETLKRESAEGIASIAKNKYLICTNVQDIYGEKLWDSKGYWVQNTKLIDSLVETYMQNRLDEETLRELARTEPWRTVWGTSKSEGTLFGIPAVMFTSEQKALVTWSRIYDSIYESMNCPPDEVISEDDMLDGWLILQSRERDEERKKSHGFGGDKKGVKGQEVFMMAENPEDASRIHALNDPNSKAILRQRMQALQKSGGRLSEEKMPDSQLTMRQQAMQQMRQHLQKGK